ncbi:MAG: hypothetical protein ACRD6W_01435 [Nitrososphaerales archaeon]
MARNAELVNKFEEDWMPSAVNIKDYLEGLGDYQDVSIFQLSFNGGLSKDWVKLATFDS